MSKLTVDGDNTLGVVYQYDLTITTTGGQSRIAVVVSRTTEMQSFIAVMLVTAFL